VGLKVRELLAHLPLGFLIALGLGILTAIVTLSGLLGAALENPQQSPFVFIFFAGLVLASIVAIGLKTTWNPLAVVMVIIGAVGAFILVGLRPPTQEPSHDLPILFVSGMIAITAMILPGISGSFMLLLMGQYFFILNAVRERDILPIAVLGLGCVVGIVIFSRVLSWLLRNYYNPTVALLVGFMIGSLRKLWEGDAKPGGDLIVGANAVTSFDAGQIALAVVIFALGFIIVSVIDHIAGRDNPLILLITRRTLKAPSAQAAD
jgi:putative membrane protein